MATVVLDLPDAVVQRASKVAQTLHRSLEDVLTTTLTNTLPDVEDVPAHLQTELLQMTWLSDQKLIGIAQSQLSDSEQTQLTALSQRSDNLTVQEQQILRTLRESYGLITLRKARAYALLSLCGGKLLLADSQPA